MTENESHKDNEQYSKKAVDDGQWELADIEDFAAHILSTEARAAPLLFSTSPRPYPESDDDSRDDFRRFFSAPVFPWVETAESRFEFATNHNSLDVNPLCHFQMAETALTPLPISGPSPLFKDTFIPSYQGEKETNINKKHSTGVTHTSHSLDFQDFFKPSEECGMQDDSISCSTNVTLDDLEIEPFNPDTEKFPIDNQKTSKNRKPSPPPPPPPIKKRKVQHQVEDDDQVFALNLKALSNFKAKWGHCRVPPENDSLHQWCEHIRKAYGLKCSGKLESKSPNYKAITDTQFQQLKDIGFEFFSGGKPPKSFKEKRLHSLKNFISKFGHCKVPKRYKEDKGLGPWCCEMRHSYKMIQDGKKPRSILTMAMYEDLQSLGFAWTV